MAPKIGTGEDYSCWDDGMARRKVGEEEESNQDQTRKQVCNQNSLNYLNRSLRSGKTMTTLCEMEIFTFLWLSGTTI